MSSDETVEVPDAAYGVLDHVTTLLCTQSLPDLSPTEQGNLEIMLAELFDAIHAKAEEMADAQPVPGKIQETVLSSNIAGYHQAKALATYLEHLLT